MPPPARVKTRWGEPPPHAGAGAPSRPGRAPAPQPPVVTSGDPAQNAAAWHRPQCSPPPPGTEGPCFPGSHSHEPGQRGSPWARTRRAHSTASDRPRDTSTPCGAQRSRHSCLSPAHRGSAPDSAPLSTCGKEGNKPPQDAPREDLQDRDNSPQASPCQRPFPPSPRAAHSW